MAKDAVATMGALLPDDASGRDAVHVAVFSARAPVRVFPGQHVGLVSDETVEHSDMVVSPLAPPIGIIDPFLGTEVTPGARFWVYLYPRTITSLSHKWGHPAFGETATAYAPPAAKLVSEEWLKDFCDGYSDKDYGFDMMIVLRQVFDGQYLDDEYLTIYGSDEKGPIPSELWHHASIVFGKPIPARHPTYFSCSC